MIGRSWNMSPFPFYKVQLAMPRDYVTLFNDDGTTFATPLKDLLATVVPIAYKIAQCWSRPDKMQTFKQLIGITFQHANQTKCNAWCFRHGEDMPGFFIVPLLVAVQPTTVMVDLVVPIGPGVTDCRGDPLEIRFFPKVIVHNALWQLLDVRPNFLPDIIGVNVKAVVCTLAHRLLGNPTWEDIVRAGVVAAQYLADPRSYPIVALDTPAATPIPIAEIVVDCDNQSLFTAKTHPELFHFIRHGQSEAALSRAKQEPLPFTPDTIYDRIKEVVEPLVRSSLHACLLYDVPVPPPRFDTPDDECFFTHAANAMDNGSVSDVMMDSDVLDAATTGATAFST